MAEKCGGTMKIIAEDFLTSPPARRYSIRMARRGDTSSGGGICHVPEKTYFFLLETGLYHRHR